MRVMLIGLVGGTTALAAFAVSRVSGGFVEAGSFLLAIFIVPVTIGLLTAAAVDGVERWRAAKGGASADVAPRFQGSRVRRKWPVRSTMRCGACRRRKARIQFVWVCALCDGIAVDV